MSTAALKPKIQKVEFFSKKFEIEFCLRKIVCTMCKEIALASSISVLH